MERPPPFSGLTAGRHALRFGRDPLAFLDALRTMDEDLVRARFVVGPSLTFVNDPELVRQVLVDDYKRYGRPDVQSGRTTRLTENGLIESDGALWSEQRERLQPLFSRDRIGAYADAIGEFTTDTIDSWHDSEHVDLYEEMTELTVRVIAKSLFSTDLDGSDTERFVRANATIGEEFEISPTALFRQFLPTPPSNEYQQVVSEMHEWAEGIIDRHRRMDDPPNDLVTTMLEAQGRDDTDLPETQVRDEVLTFLFAGHETTALTLGFALWFTARHPEVATRVRDEARDVLDGDQPGWEHLADLTYTERVVRETLRLRPSSWGIFRQAKLASPLGGQRIERGDFLMCPQWTLHRDARYFDNPETFDPDRWETLEPSRTPAYFPFGAGPHACIGGQLALTEAQLVLAALVSEFDFEVADGTAENLRPAGVLQPRDGIPATVHKAR